MKNKILLLIFSLSLLFTSCQNVKKKNPENIKIDFSTNQQYKFTQVDNELKMAYLDIGNKENPTILLLHGEPNSSFAYRNIAPLLVLQNYRVIIPDLVGFGYSDKPTDSTLVTYSNQTKWLHKFIENLKLENIHLFAHDWGGMISLRIVAKNLSLIHI